MAQFKSIKDDPFYKRHYLINIKYPNETYSVKEYQDGCKIIDKERKSQTLLCFSVPSF